LVCEQESIKLKAMESKKNKFSDFEAVRSTNFFVGLLTMGGLSLAAFTYSNESEIAAEKKKVKAIDIEYFVAEEKPVEMPKIKLPAEQKQPEKQQEATINIQRTVDESISASKNTNTEIKTEVTLGGIDKKFDDEIKNEVIVEVDPEIFETPTIDAKFQGDYPAMMKFIGQNLNYPQEAINLHEFGVVYVSFVVEKNGEITNVAAVNKVAPSLEKEAIRLVRSFPTWIPGEVNLQKVRTRVRLPIRFELH
jgi:protein TonB